MQFAAPSPLRVEPRSQGPAQRSRPLQPLRLRELGLGLVLSLLLGCDRGGAREDQVHSVLDHMVGGRIARPGLAYGLVYRLYVPPRGDPARRYPLLLFLHGSGDRGDDNRKQVGPELAQLIARLQSHEPMFILAPQCPGQDKWVSGVRSAPFLNYRMEQRPESDAMKLVRALLDDLQHAHPIDPARVYVSGHSSGAAGAWDLVSRRPGHRFAAAVPVSGTNDPSRAPWLATLPLWVFHGARDRTSPASNSREMVSALRALGSQVRYTEFPQLGHDTLDSAYQEPGLVAWLLAQRRSPPQR